MRNKIFALSVIGTMSIRLSHVARALPGQAPSKIISSSGSTMSATFLMGPRTLARTHHNRHSISQLCAKPKRGNIIDSYQTISVNCAKCGNRLFRYKKKNGTKSNLVKCYVERIADDCSGVLRAQGMDAGTYECPSCQTQFARSAMIRGLPALKLVGGKTRMTRK